MIIDVLVHVSGNVSGEIVLDNVNFNEKLIIYERGREEGESVGCSEEMIFTINLNIIKMK